MLYSRAALLIGLAVLACVRAECPNACSGHGDCTRFDMCQCWRNWQAADCSERTCPFGLAHVDTPKGDLDGSNEVTGTDTLVVVNSEVYPHGTHESYPLMQNSAGDKLSNTAHAYMECSNKGICNRAAGECHCMPGYEGHACQRASCPNSCSGHGVCKSIKQIAADDYDNVYRLWDKDATLGCVCDAGYTGPDCSLRQCKHGVDPLYVDDVATARYPTWTFAVKHDNPLEGTYTVRFFDVFGEDWYTAPITAPDCNSASCCTNLVRALEALPNDAIPKGSVRCTGAVDGDYEKMTVTFTGNPGALREPQLSKYYGSSSGAPTIWDSDGQSADDVELFVYQAGVSGEAIDYFAELCAAVTVTVDVDGVSVDVDDYDGDSTTSDELRLFKQCLGDADGDMLNNVEVFNWDYGSDEFPHAIKLVQYGAADDTIGGIYGLLQYDSVSQAFSLRNVVPAGKYYVFTTSGVAHRLADGDGDNVPAYVPEFSDIASLRVDAACGTSDASPCLSKGNFVFVEDGTSTTLLNLFTVTKVWTARFANDDMDGTCAVSAEIPEFGTPTSLSEETIYQFRTDKHFDKEYDTANVYVFNPPTIGQASHYEYAGECSGRGVCDTVTGLCQCFAGYTNDACDVQSSLAK